MNWYKQSQREYPYYIAVVLEGRFKGMYPKEIANIPSMKKRWDSGGLGTGKRIAGEIVSTNPTEIISNLMSRYGMTNSDNVDFYVVEAPNSPRRRLRYHEFMMLQQPTT